MVGVVSAAPKFTPGLLLLLGCTQRSKQRHGENHESQSLFAAVPALHATEWKHPHSLPLIVQWGTPTAALSVLCLSLVLALQSMPFLFGIHMDPFSFFEKLFRFDSKPFLPEIG